MTLADDLDDVGAHLVEVFAPEKRNVAVQLFVALVPRSAAVGAVSQCIPSDHHAVLSHRVLNSDEVSALALRPGQVRQIEG